MSGITQEPGWDTSIDTFQPSRANPVARRAVRKYYCQQNINGTSIFDTLTWKIHQNDPTFVMNEVRMVFPLEVQCLGIAPGLPVGQPLSMAVGDAQAACNVAVGQNSPFSAFSVIDTSINGRVWTERPQEYGKVLSKCWQSVSELQFQNNHSLKPICNTNRRGSHARQQTYNVMNAGVATGEDVTISRLQVSQGAFSLEQANSGFLERSRAFQQGLIEGGTKWVGEISSLMNTAVFSNEARGQGNDAIPFCMDLFINAVFGSRECQFDSLFRTGEPHDYRRIIPQGLFEFLTPTLAHNYQEELNYAEIFPHVYTIKWVGKPFLAVEWIQYKPQNLLPMYRLRGFRYQHLKSNEFSLALQSKPEERIYKTMNVQQTLLAVPNLIYIWAEPTIASSRYAFFTGGVPRFNDIKSLRVRVNGNVDIIQNPNDQSMLYKWFKRATNNVQEFPTWSKNKVIVISPEEVGLENWLAGDSSLSTLDITCEVGHSRLQISEYNPLNVTDVAEMNGYEYPRQQWYETWRYTFAQRNYTIPIDYQLSWTAACSGVPNIPLAGSYGEFQISATKPYQGLLADMTEPVIASTKSDLMTTFLGNINIRAHDKDHKEIMRIQSIRTGPFVAIENCIWFKYNIVSDAIILEFWYVKYPNYYTFRSPDEFTQVEWDDGAGHHTFTVDQNGDINGVEGAARPRIHAAINSFQGKGYDRLQLLDQHPPCFIMNEDDTQVAGDPFDYSGSIPSSQAIAVTITGGRGIHHDVVQNGGFADIGQAGWKVINDVHANVGWRWVCMAPPPTGSVYESMLRHGNIAGDGTQRELASISVNMERGVRGTPLESWEAFNHSYEIQSREQVTHTNNFKYELNVLCEYSNQQIVMDKSRGKPISISNNVPTRMSPFQ